MATKPPEKPEPAGVPEISEPFLLEWVKYGMAEMHIYMTKHAQFDAWLLRHPDKTEENTDAS